MPVLILIAVILYLDLSHHSGSIKSDSAQSASGLPASSAPAGSLSLITEPADGTGRVLSMINNARHSVALVMYELEDPQVEQALIKAHQRGLQVRVLLNGGYYGAPDKSQPNKPAYEMLQKYGVPVRYTPGYFALTHQKTLVVDNSQSLIMTFNLTPQYYPTSRDFGVIDRDTHDVTAITDAFNADWRNQKITASSGDDLLWSPGSEAASVALIHQARSSIKIYNEEMADSDIVSALGAAAMRGVDVEVVMTDQSSWHSNFSKLESDGAHVHVYKGETPLYIHAKMILVDDSKVFLGSENFSVTSLQRNRELGIITGDKAMVAKLNSTFSDDFHNAPEY